MFKNKKNYFIPIIGFILIILIGSAVLYMPFVNTKNISYRDCLFVATSSVTTIGICKTPIINQFDFLGQLVIAVLMEIGALGFIIFISYFWNMKNKKIKISDIIVINDSINGDDYSNIKKHSIFICRFMFRVQAIGATFFMLKFIPLFGFFKGCWYSIFHSISSFSNTGYDLFGEQGMKLFVNDSYIQIIMIILMVLGSLGILVIEDLKDKKFKFNKLKVQTKIVVVATIILLIVPTILIKLYDSELSILNSLFMTASTRSTAYSIVDINTLSVQSKGILVILMLIGGGPTSTAGGIRILPIVVLLATIISTLRGKTDTIIYWRKISPITIRRALTIVFVFMLMILIGTVAIYEISDIGIEKNIFDSISIISNTGYTIMNVAEIDVIGEYILMFLMFVGRVGPLSMVLAFVNDNAKDKFIEYPSENIVL